MKRTKNCNWKQKSSLSGSRLPNGVKVEVISSGALGVITGSYINEYSGQLEYSIRVLRTHQILSVPAYDVIATNKGDINYYEN